MARFVAALHPDSQWALVRLDRESGSIGFGAKDMSDTTKTDSMLDYIFSLDNKTLDAVRAYRRRLTNSGLPTPTLEMVRDFVAVHRAGWQPQHLQGDGFDYIETDR